MNSTIIKISVLINFFCFISVSYIFFHYELPRRVMEYFFGVPHINCINNTKIIVMGDSRINVNWNRLMGRNDIVSIHGGQIEDLIERVDFAYELKPELCLVMIGINDMFWMKTPKETFEDYKKLMEKMLRKKLNIVIQSLLYVGPIKIFYREQNKEVDELNAMLRKYCEEMGIVFLDLNKYFSENAHLIMEYSSDGVHINDKGYKVWKKELIPLLNSMNL